MVRRGVASCVVVLIALGLTGCGMFRFEQREPWRIQAEEACLSQRLVQPSSYMSRSSSIDGPGACGISYPFKVSAFGGGSVGLSQRATLACPIIPRVDAWLNDTVQPAAALYFGAPVVELRAGSYACRGRNNQRGAKLSEHSFGNAVDVMAFRLADGRLVTVKGGWRGAQAEQEFLREVFVGACRHFTTVLGPGSDMFHYDHFHIDLARHDPAGKRRVCRPVIKFTPRVGPDAAPMAQTPRTVPAWSAPGPARPVRPPVEDDAPAAEDEGWEEMADAPAPPTPAPRWGAPVAARPAPPAAWGAVPAPMPVPRGPSPALGGSPPGPRLLPPAEVGTGRIY